MTWKERWKKGGKETRRNLGAADSLTRAHHTRTYVLQVKSLGVKDRRLKRGSRPVH